ncbi:MAG: glycosyltransferase family 2 protein [Pseudomonadota bacterium]
MGSLIQASSMPHDATDAGVAGPPDASAAIVTTLRAAGAYLDSYARYHLQTGFSHLYLFLDDPAEVVPDWLREDRRVTLIPRDASLESRWRTIALEHELLGFAHAWRDREVMARQLLNVKVAIDLARAAGLRWLLHIDVDELFHCAEGSVADHFRNADAMGLRQVHYANHELVPQAWQASDVVREETLFKLSPAAVGDTLQRWFLDRFPQRPRYFNYYHWGKAAARLDAGLLPGMTVHEFTVPGQALPSLAEAFQPSTRAHRQPVLQTDPCILHYTIAGFDEFVRKYRVLGSFPDRWFGNGVDIKTAIPFHVAARDAVADPDPDAAAAFFRDNVLFSPPEIEELIARGVCRHFTRPAQLLAGRSSAPSENVA